MADHSEVLVCMHATESDDRCALHRGTRVRKNHTSRRDAFETVGARPLGTVEYDSGSGEHEVSFRREHADRGVRGDPDGPDGQGPRGDDPAIHPDLETDVDLVKFVPGMDPAVLESLGEAGIVIEGTGLGHVNTDWIPVIEELVADGTHVVMTSGCIEGRVCDRVYDTGRDLLDAGVIEAGDTLPGTAMVKLMWALANTDAPAEAMRRSLAGEIQARSTPWR
jgi:glutamyl-tRNA(Gln) amidotransferase subunit D